MRRNITNEDFLKYGVYLLGNLALDDTLKSQIGTEGGVSLIVQIMEMYGGNEALVENSLYALANLSFQNPVNNRFIVSGNGIDLLCSVIATYTTNEELLESGVCVLCNLCYGSDSNKESICHAGGASVIADVVLNNFNADDLLITCFRTLGNLAFNASNVAIIVKAGGVQGIVAGMTVHSENVDIVDVAIRVLTNLAAAADTESMKIMSSEGAVQAIIEGAQTYDDNLRLSVGSYGCLWTLAREPTNATMMVKQHAQKAVISSFNKLGFDENLCDKGLRLIAVLTSHNSNLRRLEKSGIVSAIVTSMSAHSGNQYIVSSGLVCLARLAFGEQAALKMEEECKVVKLVLGIFKAGVGDPHIVNECFAALGGICRAAANAGKMATAAFTLCAKAVQNHIQNVPVVSHAFVFVSNLAVHKEASSVADQSPIVSAILVGMRQHRVDPSVLIRGCHALENIAYGPKQVKEHLKTEGVLDAMHQVREENAANDDVCIAAQSVIDAINRDDDLVQRQYVSMKPADLGKRSARDIFGDSKEGKNVVMELPNKIRNFLCAGALLSKHSNSAEPRPRHVYVTTDLKYFIWKDPKKQLKPENKMKVIRMREVERGRCTKQLQRKNSGSFLAKEEGAFAVRGKDRTVDLEAPSEGDREKWVNALQMLIDYTKYQKSVNKLFTSR
jgi:hypothetical protein